MLGKKEEGWWMQVYHHLGGAMGQSAGLAGCSFKPPKESRLRDVPCSCCLQMLWSHTYAQACI